MTGEAPITTDELSMLETGLAGAARALDREIAASGASARVAGRVMAGLAARRRARRAIWFAVAAALIVAAGLGSLTDLTLIGARTNNAGQDVVVMDPLIFGTTLVDQR